MSTPNPVDPDNLQNLKSGGHSNEKKTLDGLSALQYRFCIEYCKDLNAVQAYIRAGGSSVIETARNQVSLYLSLPQVRKKIQAIAREAIADKEVSSSVVLQALAALATTSITDVATWDEDGRVRLVPSDKLAPHHAYAIQSIKQVTTRIPQGKGGEPIEQTTLEVKLYDKRKPLELLGKHLGLFDKSKIEGSADLGKRLEEAKARNEKRKLRLVSGDQGGMVEDANVVDDSQDDAVVIPGIPDDTLE